MQWNCRGYYSNYSSFKVLLNRRNPAVVALQETKQRATQRNLLCPRAYVPITKPFTGGEIASGGVGLLINRDLIQAEI